MSAISSKNLIAFKENQVNPPQQQKDNKNLYVNGGIVAGATAVGTIIGSSSYNSDKVELNSAITKAKSELIIPELEKSKTQLKTLFSDKIYMEKKEGRSLSYPNSIMLVGENLELNNELIKELGQNADCKLGCHFVQINYDDKVSAQLKEAKQRYEKTKIRTLIHVDGFDKFINPQISPDDKIESVKSVLSNCAKRFHSTLIFSTADPSKLDQIAIQDHRVTRIDVNVKKADFDKMKAAKQKFEELNGKLKELPKIKIFAGAAIGLAVGAIGIGIKHLISQKDKA
jgi:hypothetical protein